MATALGALQVHVAFRTDRDAMGPVYDRGVGMLVNTATDGNRRNCSFQWSRSGDCWLVVTEAVPSGKQLLADYNIF